MLREGLTIILEYREGDEPYAVRTEIPLYSIEMANEGFRRQIGHIAEGMWHKMEKELFNRG